MVKLTRRDYKLFDEIVKTDSIKYASRRAGMSQSAAYNRGRRIRSNVVEARTFLNRVLAQSRRSQKLKNFIWPKAKIEIESTLKEAKKEEEEEEEL